MDEPNRKRYGRVVGLMVAGVESMLQVEPATVVRNGKEFIVPAPYFFHNYQSDLEDYADQLLKLDLLTPLIDLRGDACFFRLVCYGRDVEAIASDKAETGPPLLRLLASVVYFAGVAIQTISA